MKPAKASRTAAQLSEIVCYCTSFRSVAVVYVNLQEEDERVESCHSTSHEKKKLDQR